MTQHFTRNTVSAVKIAVVRARQKPISELPVWALCCDAIVEVYRVQGVIEVDAVPSTVFLAEVECRFCHRIVRDVKYVRHLDLRKKGAVPIDCFEFDEKPLAYIHPRRLR